MTLKLGYAEKTAIAAMIVEVMEPMRDTLVRWYISEHREEYNAFVRERGKVVLRKYAVEGMRKIAGEHVGFAEETEKAWDEASEALFVTQEQADEIIEHFAKMQLEVPEEEGK